MAGSTSPPFAIFVVGEIEGGAEAEALERAAGKSRFVNATRQLEPTWDVQVGRPGKGDRAVAGEHQVRVARCFLGEIVIPSQDVGKRDDLGVTGELGTESVML